MPLCHYHLRKGEHRGQMTTDARLFAAGDGPTGPGTYALLIALERSAETVIGRLGRFRFPAGFYLYVGSALGPGGLAGRLARHLRADKRLHWHVDYVLHARSALVLEVWTKNDAVRRECDWARAAMRLAGASVVVPRFGASDCRCAAHLYGFAAMPDLIAFASLAGCPVERWVMR